MHDSHEAEYVDYVTAEQIWLRRTAYLLCQDWHAADDIAQSTITTLYLKWAKVRNAAHIDAYVRSMLVRTFLIERRSRWAQVSLGTYDDDRPARPADSDLALDIRAAIAGLPPKQRASMTTLFRHTPERESQQRHLPDVPYR